LLADAEAQNCVKQAKYRYAKENILES